MLIDFNRSFRKFNYRRNDFRICGFCGNARAFARLIHRSESNAARSFNRFFIGNGVTDVNSIAFLNAFGFIVYRRAGNGPVETDGVFYHFDTFFRIRAQKFAADTQVLFKFDDRSVRILSYCKFNDDFTENHTVFGNINDRIFNRFVNSNVVFIQKLLAADKDCLAFDNKTPFR